MDDNKRAAAGIIASLSSTLLGGGLAVIAAEAALITYYLEQRTISNWAVLLLILSPVAVIASWYYGCTAIDKLAAEGFRGNWSIDRPATNFDRQAIGLLVSGILLMVSPFLTSAPQASNNPDGAAALSSKIARLETRIQQLEHLSQHRHGTCHQEHNVR